MSGARSASTDVREQTTRPPDFRRAHRLASNLRQKSIRENCPMQFAFIVRLLVNAAALWVATRVVSGVEYTGGWIPFFGVALVFGVINAFVGRLTKILTFPLIVLTLGLFLLVVNGLMLWLTSALAEALGLGFHVRGFGPAFWGALVVSIVSTALGFLVVDKSFRVTTVRTWTRA
jgi:putative membrane protein